MLHYALFITFTIFTFSSTSNAETINLKNGSSIKGSIVEMNETEIIIDTADMGRLTIKRRTVKSITDGESENTSSPNINVNVNQNVDQNNQQENNQTVNVEAKADDSLRQWEDGIFGRLAFGNAGLEASLDGETVKEGPIGALSSTFGLAWDIVGYRSADWWAISFSIAGGNDNNDFNENLEISWNNIGLLLEANFWRKSLGNRSLSQYRAGVRLGTTNIYVRDSNIESSEVRYEGSGTSVVLGYDYLIGDNFGITAQVESGNALLELEQSDEDKKSGQLIAEYNLPNQDKEIKLATHGYFFGLFWNVD